MNGLPHGQARTRHPASAYSPHSPPSQPNNVRMGEDNGKRV